MDTFAAAERASYQRELQALRTEIEILRRYAGLKGQAEELAEMARPLRIPVSGGSAFARSDPDMQILVELDEFKRLVMAELRDNEVYLRMDSEYLLELMKEKLEGPAAQIACIAFCQWRMSL